MGRGAKSKDFVHPGRLGYRLKPRNKALPCQWKFPRGPGPKGAWWRTVSRLCAVIVRNRCGISSKLFDRADGVAVTAAARNRLTGVERQLEISVRTCLKSADAREIDQPRPVHPHDIERYQPRFLGRQGCSDEVIGAVCEAVFDIISGRTDPKNVAGFDPDTRRTVAEPDHVGRR